jgi:hypothetical protein
VRRCGRCGAEYRGRGARILVLGETGTRPVVACPRCQRCAVPVASEPGQTKCACGEAAAVCPRCVLRLAAVLRKRAQQCRADGLHSYADGLTDAAAVVETGDVEPLRRLT